LIFGRKAGELCGYRENRRIKYFIVKDLIPQQIRFRLLAELHRLDVLSTRAFLAPAFCIRDLLTLLQVVEAHALNARRMKKQVFVASRIDESKPLVRQFFDVAFGHLSDFLSDCLN
jgi:hypothetical protein